MGEKMKRNVWYEKYMVMLLMLTAYAFLLIGVVKSNPMHTTSDELGGLAGAAYYAGLDWSGVISNSGYYGFGYYSFFFWLFKITDSPFVIYKVITLITVLFRVLIIPIAYCISKRYLRIGEGLYLYLLSFLMPFLHTSTVGIISNEYILEFLIWFILLLMCKQMSASNFKESFFYSLGLIGVCFYSLFIHTRALTMLIAISIVYFAYGIVKKNKWSIVIISGIFFVYYLSKNLIGIYQKNVYALSGGEVRNGRITVNHSFSFLDKNVWDIWFRMLVGMIETESIITGGLFLIGIVTVIYYLLHLLKKRNSILSLQGNMILVVTILCMGATIVAFLVSDWFGGMLKTWGIPEAAREYGYKGLTYVRYWNVYVPPFLMCVFAVFPQLPYKRIINISIIVITVVNVLFINKLIPLVKYNNGCASFLYGIGHYEKPFFVSEEFYFKCIAISLIATLFALVAVRTKFSQYILIIFTVYMMAFHLNEQVEYNLTIKEQISSKITASYYKKCELEKQKIEFGTIYLNDETSGMDTNWKIYSVAQFYFNRYTLQMELPHEIEENDIIISTNRSQVVEETFNDINCYVLDDNEIWYTYLNIVDL